MTFTEKEAKVLKEFIRRFRFSLWAFLHEKPRSTPEAEYQARLDDIEKRDFLKKLDSDEKAAPVPGSK